MIFIVFQKSEPKYKNLWHIDRAYFYKAFIPESRLPVFVFSIKVQEIFCNISVIDKRIVDGADDRLMQNEYLFSLTPHHTPDVLEC